MLSRRDALVLMGCAVAAAGKARAEDDLVGLWCGRGTNLLGTYDDWDFRADGQVSFTLGWRRDAEYEIDGSLIKTLPVASPPGMTPAITEFRFENGSLITKEELQDRQVRFLRTKPATADAHPIVGEWATTSDDGEQVFLRFSRAGMVLNYSPQSQPLVRPYRRQGATITVSGGGIPTVLQLDARRRTLMKVASGDECFKFDF